MATERQEMVSIVKRFDEADRVLSFENGRLEIISVGGCTIGKGSLAPGWRWSAIASRGPGGALPEHVGVVLSGRAKVRIREGSEIDLMPGDFFHITTEEDVWVVGYRPCEILYLDGVESLTRQMHRLP
jgi:hypothetical protein